MKNSFVGGGHYFTLIFVAVDATFLDLDLAFDTLNHKNETVNLCKIVVMFFDIEIDIRRETG